MVLQSYIINLLYAKFQAAFIIKSLNILTYTPVFYFSAIDPIGTLEALFIPIRFAIDGARARRVVSRENGAKGGAPKGNRNAVKKTTENNQIQPKTTLMKMKMKRIV